MDKRTAKLQKSKNTSESIIGIIIGFPKFNPHKSKVDKVSTFISAGKEVDPDFNKK